MQRIKRRDLDIVNERHAAEAIRVPERHLTRLLPGAHQEALHRQVHGKQVGVVGVEDSRWMKNQIEKKQQPRQGQKCVWL